VLLADGTVYSWGGDTFGQLSDGKVGQGFNSIPARVVGLEDVKAIAAGAVGVSMAVTQEPSGQATVWIWGRGAGGETCVKDHQVPAPRATTRTVQVLLPCGGAPVKATGLPSIATVAARSGRTERSSALWRHWYWDTGTVSVPRACDQYDFCRDTALLAIADDGQLWAWDNGRTGGMNVVTSQQVGLGDVRSLATGRSHYLALRADGTVWAWGLDGSGQLGS
jgi:alpha-tubulin suppressor-like RCC1 family protein